MRRRAESAELVGLVRLRCAVCCLATGRDATPTNICSASLLAKGANRHLKLFRCCGVCTITAPVPQRPLTRNFVFDIRGSFCNGSLSLRVPSPFNSSLKH